MFSFQRIPSLTTIWNMTVSKGTLDKGTAVIDYFGLSSQMVHLGCVYVLGSVELPPNIYGERFEAASALRYIREVMRILRM